MLAVSIPMWGRVANLRPIANRPSDGALNAHSEYSEHKWHWPIGNRPQVGNPPHTTRPTSLIAAIQVPAPLR